MKVCHWFLDSVHHCSVDQLAQGLHGYRLSEYGYAKARNTRYEYAGIYSVRGTLWFMSLNPLFPCTQIFAFINKYITRECAVLAFQYNDVLYLSILLELYIGSILSGRPDTLLWSKGFCILLSPSSLSLLWFHHHLLDFLFKTKLNLWISLWKAQLRVVVCHLVTNLNLFFFN